jgi:CRISPR-associated protein Cas1
MSVLYLVEQGATLRKDGDTLVVTKNDSELQVIPASKVGQVVIFGNVNITTPVIRYMLRNGVDCAFCSSAGKYHGRLFSTESKFGQLRRLQFRATENEVLGLHLAIQIIKGKLSNQRTLLMRYQRGDQEPDIAKAIDAIETSIAGLEKVNDINELLGKEGYASAQYFAAFKKLLKQDMGFNGRIKRPPTDPVNSLLSLGYTLLVYDAQSAIRTVGLDPFLGFLHSTQYSKPSLALDLIEELRTVIVDSLVLRLVNSNMLKEDDFSRQIGFNSMVLLKQETLKSYIGHYEDRILTEVVYPATNIQVNYRRCIELQARQIASIITGKQTEYKPFLIR